jgi:glycosyltransferase involved in cell wall biosynthesis
VRKILVLTSHHPSRRRPLQALYGYYTYQALARYCEIRFVAPAPWWTRWRWPGEIARPPVERWGELEVEFPAYWSIPGATPLHAAGMAVSLAGRIRAIRREFPFEAILTAWAYPDAVAAARIAAREKVPLVATVLGSDVNVLTRKPALRSQILGGLSQARRVVAVSEALGDELVRLGLPRERIVVQHNGVDGNVFAIADRSAARAALGLPPDRSLVGYVGRLSHEKGIDVVVEAMGELVRREPRPVDLVVVGSGPMEQPLRARASALGLADRVRFAGHRGHEELPRWLSALDVFCLPSRSEGCPNVVLEALASGRPVVASAVGGVPELLRRDNGILVPPDRPAALAEALGQALDRTWDPEALRATVPSLSWDAVARTYRQLVEDVIAEASAGGAGSARTPAGGPPRWARGGSSRAP